MSILANITIADADLANIKGDIDNYKFSGQANFTNEITIAKRKVYRELKVEYANLYPSYTDAELETKLDNVKDLPSQYLKDAIVYHVLADVMLANEMTDMAQYYKDIAKSIPLKAYVDEDSDSVVDDSEQLYARRAMFGR